MATATIIILEGCLVRTSVEDPTTHLSWTSCRMQVVLSSTWYWWHRSHLGHNHSHLMVMFEDFVASNFSRNLCGNLLYENGVLSHRSKVGWILLPNDDAPTCEVSNIVEFCQFCRMLMLRCQLLPLLMQRVLVYSSFSIISFMAPLWLKQRIEN